MLGQSVRKVERWMTVLDLGEPTVIYLYQDGEDSRVFDSVSSLKGFLNFGCLLGEILCSRVGKIFAQILILSKVQPQVVAKPE